EDGVRQIGREPLQREKTQNEDQTNELSRSAPKMPPERNCSPCCSTWTAHPILLPFRRGEGKTPGAVTYLFRGWRRRHSLVFLRPQLHRGGESFNRRMLIDIQH